MQSKRKVIGPSRRSSCACSDGRCSGATGGCLTSSWDIELLADTCQWLRTLAWKTSALCNLLWNGMTDFSACMDLISLKASCVTAISLEIAIIFHAIFFELLPLTDQCWSSLSQNCRCCDVPNCWIPQQFSSQF